MWNFIKTSASVLGLFIIIVLLAGLYSVLVQEDYSNEPNSEPKNGNKYKTLPGNEEPVKSATSSDTGSSESILENIPSY